MLAPTSSGASSWQPSDAAGTQGSDDGASGSPFPRPVFRFGANAELQWREEAKGALAAAIAAIPERDTATPLVLAPCDCESCSQRLPAEDRLPLPGAPDVDASKEMRWWAELQQLLQRILTETHHDDVRPLVLPLERIHHLVHKLCNHSPDELFGNVVRESKAWLECIRDRLLAMLIVQPSAQKRKETVYQFFDAFVCSYKDVCAANTVLDGVLILLMDCFLKRFNVSFADLNEGLYWEIVFMDPIIRENWDALQEHLAQDSSVSRSVAEFEEVMETTRQAWVQIKGAMEQCDQEEGTATTQAAVAAVSVPSAGSRGSGRLESWGLTSDEKWLVEQLSRGAVLPQSSLRAYLDGRNLLPGPCRDPDCADCGGGDGGVDGGEEYVDYAYEGSDPNDASRNVARVTLDYDTVARAYGKDKVLDVAFAQRLGLSPADLGLSPASSSSPPSTPSAVENTASLSHGAAATLQSAGANHHGQHHHHVCQLHGAHCEGPPVDMSPNEGADRCASGPEHEESTRRLDMREKLRSKYELRKAEQQQQQDEGTHQRHKQQPSHHRQAPNGQKSTSSTKPDRTVEELLQFINDDGSSKSGSGKKKKRRRAKRRKGRKRGAAESEADLAAVPVEPPCVPSSSPPSQLADPVVNNGDALPKKKKGPSEGDKRGPGGQGASGEGAASAASATSSLADEPSRVPSSKHTKPAVPTQSVELGDDQVVESDQVSPGSAARERLPSSQSAVPQSAEDLEVEEFRRRLEEAAAARESPVRVVRPTFEALAALCRGKLKQTPPTKDG